MKRTFGKASWLIASICFLGLACLGVALDNSQVNSPSSRQQVSKQESPQAKVTTTPSLPRRAPEPTATPPMPVPTPQPPPQPAAQPVAPAPAAPPAASAPAERKPEPNIFYGVDEGTPILTAEMEPHRLMRELEQDKSHYPVEVWCKDVNTCAAKVVRKVKDTQWQIGLFMNEEVYYQTNRRYAAQGYDFGNGQSFTDRNGILLHQAVWLKNR
jgi:type IV secretory pathway VirB10-like protein